MQGIIMWRCRREEEGSKNPWERKLRRDEETPSQRARGKHKDHGIGKRSTHGTQNK